MVVLSECHGELFEAQGGVVQMSHDSDSDVCVRACFF